MKIEFSRQIFQKYSNIKISRKSVHWEPCCFTRTDGQTDRQAGRHNETNSRFSQFC